MNEGFRSYLEEAIGSLRAKIALGALEDEASCSVRLNPFKRVEGLFEDCEKVVWSPYGRFLEERPTFTLDPLMHAGAYYVQDSSAMFVGHVLRKVLESYGGSEVLDLCAAPGGKTTDIAASLRVKYGDSFRLVANEVMRQRAAVLKENAARWGDPNVEVCSCDPKAFGAFPGSFDIIVADVPCSGEGMFRKDAEAARQWSRDNVALCAARQRRIVADVWPALKEGGVLIYSTCTFNIYENDGNLRWIRETLGAEKIELDAPEGVIETEEGCLLVPGFVPGEGQFCGAVRKTRADEGRNPCKIRHGGSQTDKFAIQAEAMSIKGGGWPRVNVDRDAALKYLHRDSIVLPEAPRGIVAVCYKGLPLGLAKNIGNRCNNLLPKEWRIRMDV